MRNLTTTFPALAPRDAVVQAISTLAYHHDCYVTADIAAELQRLLLRHPPRTVAIAWRIAVEEQVQAGKSMPRAVRRAIEAVGATFAELDKLANPWRVRALTLTSTARVATHAR